MSNIISVESISELMAINNPENGQTVYVKSYFINVGKGGGTFIFDSTKTNTNDGVINFSGWVRQISGYSISVEMGGAIGDGITDDANIIQAIVKSLYPSTIDRHSTGMGFELIFNPNSIYKINSEILLPPYCRLNGNGALLLGNGRINNCFVSAKWQNGMLIKTAGEPIGSNPYFSWSSIERFQFKQFKKNVYIYGWTQQCYLHKLESFDSEQHIVSKEHYFLTVTQCSSDWTGLGTGLANYEFGIFNGMLVVSNLSASSCDLGYYFVQGLQATTLNKLDAESVGTAIKLNGEGETGGILLTGGYYENCGTVIDAKQIGSANATIDMTNCFINGQNTIVCETTNANVAFIGQKELNYVQNHKTWLKELHASSFSSTKQSAIQITNDIVAPNSPNGINKDTNLYFNNDPIGWCKNTHEQKVTLYRAYSGKTQAIHHHFFSVIPYNYYGNQGAPEGNIIPFCQHTMTSPKNGVFDCVITTAIISNIFVQGTFNLELLTDNSKIGMLSGRFYQNSACIDINEKSLSVSVSTINNVIVLTISGLTGTSYQARGFIKLI